jgi:hypothetical protein
MEERARSAVLGEDLPETVLARDVVVLRPIENPLDLDGSNSFALSRNALSVRLSDWSAIVIV